MVKHELRRLFLHKRKILSGQEVKKFNRDIKEKFEKLLPQDIKTVHIFLPIQSKIEIDTWPIIHGLWARKIKVASPVMNPDKNTMSSWLLTNKTQIESNNWSVPEPVRSTIIKDNEIDAIVVPLLAFDNTGYRVGYGKGYYDRFIATLNPEILKIGLSFFSPVKQISDVDPWDIPLNYCITPYEIFKF